MNKEQEILEKLNRAFNDVKTAIGYISFGYTETKKDEEDFYLINKFDKELEELKQIKSQLNNILNRLENN